MGSLWFRHINWFHKLVCSHLGLSLFAHYEMQVQNINMEDKAAQINENIDIA